MDNKEIEQQERQTPKQKKSQFKKELLEWLDSLAVSLVVVIFLFNFVVMTVEVKGDSMQNTLHEGERLITSNLFYEPKNGDIVTVIRENDAPLIKRVIAVEGQEIDIDAITGEVFVDGEKLDEPYIKEMIAEGNIGINEYPLIVPEDSFFAMGDNRNDSLDSRALGTIENNRILGKVLFRISPITKFIVK